MVATFPRCLWQEAGLELRSAFPTQPRSERDQHRRDGESSPKPLRSERPPAAGPLQETQSTAGKMRPDGQRISAAVELRRSARTYRERWTCRQAQAGDYSADNTCSPSEISASVEYLNLVLPWLCGASMKKDSMHPEPICALVKICPDMQG
jgi:hypothetical protein